MVQNVMGEQWLQENQTLRMDANSELFPADRRSFHTDRYHFAAAYCHGKRVLDGACGTGYGSSILGEVAREVAGIDCADDAVAYASSTYGAPHVAFQRSFVELTPFEDASFDVVVSFETVEHTLCPEAHMREIVRLLEPTAGRAILSVPNSWGLTDHHFFDFDLPQFEQLVGRFFGQAEFHSQTPADSATLPGIGPLVPGQPAQCLIAVCSAPRKELQVENRLGAVMDEVYRNAFLRHNEYRTLAYRQNTNLPKRVINKLRSLRRG